MSSLAQVQLLEVDAVNVPVAISFARLDEVFDVSWSDLELKIIRKHCANVCSIDISLVLFVEKAETFLSFLMLALLPSDANEDLAGLKINTLTSENICICPL